MKITGRTHGDTRSIIAELELAATPGQAWKALTDPHELVNWFPFMAEIDLREGGRYDMSWQGMFGWVWEQKIIELVPGKRIKLLLHVPPEKLAERDRPLHVLEYSIESSGGRTFLRMVNSGFSTAAKWDNEYDSHFGGWSFELFALAHFLKYHFGKTRKLAWAMVKGVEPKSAFSALLGAATLSGAVAGAHFSSQLANGLTVSGKVEQFTEGSQFTGLAESLNHALFRISSEDDFLFTWLALYDISDAETRRIQTALNRALRAAFPNNTEIHSALDSALTPIDGNMVSMDFSWAK